MFKYLSDNNLIHPNHHAYRPGHNTTTALLQMYDTWREGLEKGKMCGVCLLDMSAAFDTVTHELLIKKLALLGFKHDILQWFRSYLSDRRQCVSINWALSKFLPVSSGVPQGSVLGPLLYTLFVNELPEVLNNSSEAKKSAHICCFADDTTLTCQNSDHSELSRQLTESYTKVSNYMLNNGLKLNDDKSHLVVMASKGTKRSRSANLVEIITNTKNIRPTQNEKLLGCYIQEDLKWDHYLTEGNENLMKSLNSRVNALTQLSKLAAFRTRKSIGDGIFLSKLSYLITLWSGCSKELLNSLQVIQNKAARAITRNWDISTSENLKQLGWLSVYQLS